MLGRLAELTLHALGAAALATHLLYFSSDDRTTSSMYTSSDSDTTTLQRMKAAEEQKCKRISTARCGSCRLPPASAHSPLLGVAWRQRVRVRIAHQQRLGAFHLRIVAHDGRAGRLRRVVLADGVVFALGAL